MIKFDKQLENFSHRLTLIRILKNELSASANQVYKTIIISDKDSKGYLTANQFRSIWLQETNIEQICLDKFIDEYFPVEKISYTLIARFLCFREQIANQVQKVQAKKIQNNVRHIKQIFNLELANHVTYCFLNSQIANFIPCIGSRPTKSEFQEYIICKQLVVDLQAVSKALILAQISQKIPSVSVSNKFQNDLGEPSVQNIQRIMQRLKKKVKAFGNEWLN